jgi:predicted nucleotidyltransferase component of viral defense system
VGADTLKVGSWPRTRNGAVQEKHAKSKDARFKERRDDRRKQQCQVIRSEGESIEDVRREMWRRQFTMVESLPTLKQAAVRHSADPR